MIPSVLPGSLVSVHLGMPHLAWICPAVWIGLFLAILRRGSRRRDRVASEVLSKLWHEISLSAEGLRSRTSAAESVWYWSSIRRIDLRDGFLLLSSSDQFWWVIPVKAFSTEDEAQAFLATARRLRDSAPSTAGTPEDPPRPREGDQPVPEVLWAKRESSSSFSARYTVVLVVLLAAATLGQYFASTFEYLRAESAFVGQSVSMLACFLLCMQCWIRWSSTKPASRTRVRVEAKGLRGTNWLCDWLRYWSEVEVEETPDEVRISTRGPYPKIVIPQSGFDHPAAAKSFVEQMRKHIRAAAR